MVNIQYVVYCVTAWELSCMYEYGRPVTTRKAQMDEVEQQTRQAAVWLVKEIVRNSGNSPTTSQERPTGVQPRAGTPYSIVSDGVSYVAVTQGRTRTRRGSSMAHLGGKVLLQHQHQHHTSTSDVLGSSEL
ncbi:hypothetical protein F503_08378 [Ophiostoma piceae UAMH 11346]|uniref:Uncharacterized protein n=1 Tax=Ophiostoma piceae (strain UAMH 11346) TaxID=1262450 RepID=S3BZ96_OPHP1|nr:hypothetical protein F503_08378 [Ophiostoma piceae UAMH 11346]